MTFDNQNKKTGVKSILLAIENSCHGFYWMKENDRAFRQELLLVPILVIVSFFMNVNAIERIMLITSLFLIVLTTTINTAIEVIVDRISLDINELSGLAKDIGSAAVLISFIIGALVWGGILFSNS